MEKIKVFDLHTDLLTSNLAINEKEEKIATIKKCGNKACLALYLFDILGKIDDYLKIKNISNLAIEDLGSANDEDEIFRLKPKYISLTHNLDNKYAGGALGNGKLTTCGRKTVRRMSENGVILDLAHINRYSFFDALERADKVMISHTCFNEVHFHKRNVTKEQISAVINKKGIVGLTFVGEFLSEKKKATVFDIVRHIDWFCENFGHKNLAIGTDFFGTKNGVIGINDYTDFIKIKRELLNIGYNNIQIEDIFYNNANNFFRSM